MIYLIQNNLITVLAALVIGIATGWWIWARARHRISLAETDDDRPLARTLERAAPPAQSATPQPAPPPSPAAQRASAAAHAGVPSPFLDAPVGEPDDLTQLKGVGPKLATLLGGLGVYHFHQIAEWTPEQVVVVDAQLGSFAGRIARDRWQQQALLLADHRDGDFELEFGAP